VYYSSSPPDSEHGDLAFRPRLVVHILPYFSASSSYNVDLQINLLKNYSKKKGEIT
jgi:hypothetical protein